MLNKETIKQIALENGFKLKEQPDGSLDLNPYVYNTFFAFEARLLNLLSGLIYKSKFSREIRKCFIEHNMTMSDVAKRLGIKVTQVSKYYNDRQLLTAEHAKSIANLLAEILGYEKYTYTDLLQMQKEAVLIEPSKPILQEITNDERLDFIPLFD